MNVYQKNEDNSKRESINASDYDAEVRPPGPGRAASGDTNDREKSAKASGVRVVDAWQ
jgi:hypothetical protein